MGKPEKFFEQAKLFLTEFFRINFFSIKIDFIALKHHEKIDIKVYHLKLVKL